MGDLLSAYGGNCRDIQGVGQSSFGDSLEDPRFELFNSQAAAFPFPMIDQTKNSATKEPKNQVLETATFIQNQPLNLSSESPRQCA